MNRAMECVFAEYQKELLEQYDLFGLEAGYETGSYSEENIKNRLAYYGADMDNQIKRIELFTDNHGQAFIREVGKYITVETPGRTGGDIWPGRNPSKRDFGVIIRRTGSGTSHRRKPDGTCRCIKEHTDIKPCLTKRQAGI